MSARFRNFNGLLLVCIWLLTTSPVAAVAGEVKIGGVVSLTGKYASYGNPVKIGTEFVVEEVNAAGGIRSLGGAKIKLVWADDASAGAKSAAELERLILGEGVSAVIGPVVTPTSLTAEPVYLRYKTPGIFCITTYDGLLEQGNPYVRTMAVLASQVGRSYAKQVQDMAKKWNIPVNRISIAYPDNDYGKAVHKHFVEELERIGLRNNLVAEVEFDYKATDLTPLVLKLKRQDPTFHVQVAYTADGKLFHDACYGLDFHPWMLGGMSGFNHPDLWKMLGEEIGSKTLGNDKTFVGNFYPTDSKLPAYKTFLEKFGARHKDVPVEMNLMMGVQAAYFLVEALEQAASTERERINEALRNLRLPVGHPRMVVSSFSPELGFTPEGKPLNARTCVQQWVKVGGEWQLFTVWPESDATRSPKGLK